MQNSNTRATVIHKITIYSIIILYMQWIVNSQLRHVRKINVHGDQKEYSNSLVDFSSAEALLGTDAYEDYNTSCSRISTEL